MALKIPADVYADAVTADDYVTQRGLREKEAWQRDRAVLGNPTASILRYTETGGVGYGLVAPTKTLVADLDDLPVAHYDGFVVDLERKYGALFTSGSRQLVFYNVQVQDTDVITFNGSEWRAVGGTIEYDNDTGKCELLVRMVDPE
jgi:hypothetical protein